MNHSETQNSVGFSKLTEEVSFLKEGDTPATLGGTPAPLGDSNEPIGGRLEFTVDEAIESIGFGLFQVRLSVFASLVWMADAMEMMMLAVLAPAVQCLWSLSSYQEATITTVVFLGMMLGSAPFGIISDRSVNS